MPRSQNKKRHDSQSSHRSWDRGRPQVYWSGGKPGVGTGALSQLWGPNTLNRPLQKARALAMLPTPHRGANRFCPQVRGSSRKNCHLPRAGNGWIKRAPQQSSHTFSVKSQMVFSALRDLSLIYSYSPNTVHRQPQTIHKPPDPAHWQPTDPCSRATETQSLGHTYRRSLSSQTQEMTGV